VVLAAPTASAISHFIPYDDGLTIEQAEQFPVDLGAIFAGVPGIVGVGHPELRDVLAAHAVKQGVTLLRGVDHVEVTPGDRPRVAYDAGGDRHHLRCRLVVVADGKDSATRKALGIDLHVTRPRVMLTGMLADDGGVWPRRATTIAVAGDTQLFVLPRGGDLVRLYVGVPVDEPRRFTGPDRHGRFLEAFRVPCLPHADGLAGATPAGPLATFPMTDSWTDGPVRPGVVLAGDAAGWSDPMIGQGLSVALRDARVLADVLLAEPQWTTGALAAYAEERHERMRRLRVANALQAVLAALGVPDRPARLRRMQRFLATEPAMAAARNAAFQGPWKPPAAAFEPGILADLALL
jgi:2-polyprenyl-6-methoxyphenol hydroxylase-like FAD-dependent oxidoreductase